MPAHRRKLFLVGLVAASIALLAGIYAGSRRSSALPAISADAVARLFASRLDDSNGQPTSFAKWQGKTLVVNFWATWCPPCREEMPAFSRLHDRYAVRGIQFVGIALDSADSVRAFAKDLPVSYPLLIGGVEGGALARDLGNSSLSLPYTVLLSPAGEVRLVRTGFLPESELEPALLRSISR